MTDTRKDKRAPISLKVRFKSATVDEFIVHILEKELQHFEDAESDEDIKNKLRGLGYIS